MAERGALVLACAALLVVVSCGGGKEPGEGGAEIRRIGLDDTAGIITKNGVSFDKAVTCDGKGSIRIAVNGQATIRLVQLGDIDLEEALLVYQAALRTEALEGETYLEMYCVFEGRGEYYSRGLDHALSGTTDWKTVSTAFRLRAGESPDIVKLNLHVNGAGTVWIDDIRLLRRPLG